LIRRPVPAVSEKHPGIAPLFPWFDTLGLDSDYDYDAVWTTCAELGVSPTFHSGARGFGLRLSPTNFVYNHIGHFAAAGEAVCKAIFLGGVTRRFPDVKFAFLEGGVGWACNLYADLIGHWEKRNRQALEETNPQHLDRALLRDLARKYGDARLQAALQHNDGLFEAEGSGATGGIADLDDYAACQIGQREDLRDLFVPKFYFGCEADDRMNAWAFNRQCNPFGARLNTLFGSDIGHFDVVNMADVLSEAYELVEDELISQEDFRDFVSTNPIRFWGEANPDFFKGTAVEKDAAAVLASAAHG
jgi:hypothetical protein